MASRLLGGSVIGAKLVISSSLSVGLGRLRTLLGRSASASDVEVLSAPSTFPPLLSFDHAGTACINVVTLDLQVIIINTPIAQRVLLVRTCAKRWLIVAKLGRVVDARCALSNRDHGYNFVLFLFLSLLVLVLMILAMSFILLHPMSVYYLRLKSFEGWLRVLFISR